MTITAAHFLRAIIDHPEDDGVRLIYADWLEEHGQAERAELIRVQCALAALLHTASGIEGMTSACMDAGCGVSLAVKTGLAPMSRDVVHHPDCVGNKLHQREMELLKSLGQRPPRRRGFLGL